MNIVNNAIHFLTIFYYFICYMVIFWHSSIPSQERHSVLFCSSVLLSWSSMSVWHFPYKPTAPPHGFRILRVCCYHCYNCSNSIYVYIIRPVTFVINIYSLYSIYSYVVNIKYAYISLRFTVLLVVWELFHWSVQIYYLHVYIQFYILLILNSIFEFITNKGT